MNLLRSRFFAVLIALLLVGGFGELAAGSCEHGHCTQTHEPAHAPQAGHDACQCLCCHQVFVHEPMEPPALAGRLPTEALVFAETGLFPPDAIPLGIDYPPRLA